ncbi:MAG TPA: hypothetical protein VFX96_16220 [Pyrinomonadaceae bacterium]|nr:hypothetical protein [Pyrinomonadaceae bacterium]
MAGGKRGRYDDIHMTPDVSYIRNTDVAHEESDVAVGPIAKFVVALFIFGVVICIAMLLLFNFFERRAQQSERRPSPLARRGAETLPPEPRLQAAPGFGVEVPGGPRRDLQLKEPQAELNVVRENWETELRSYGWADQSAGTVRIPIERAKEMYLERQRAKTQGAQQQGTQGQQPAPPTRDEETPAASSSGRTTERRNQ